MCTRRDPRGKYECFKRSEWVAWDMFPFIQVFGSDFIFCSCEIVEWESDMNRASLNTSALFSICMCCGYIIYGLTVITAIIEIPMSVINRIPFFMVAGLNIPAFTEEQQFRRSVVHLECFIGGLSVYWWGLRSNISVGIWWRLSNRRF